MPSLAVFARRLFGRASSSEEVDAPTRGRDFGFTGAAGQVVVEDPHRIAVFAVARDADARANAAYDYLRKVRKNGLRIAERVGDPAGEHAVADAMQEFAEATLLIADRLRDDLRSLGYDEFAESPFGAPPRVSEVWPDVA